jgi:BASS family bile acid:Na+ symporter
LIDLATVIDLLVPAITFVLFVAVGLDVTAEDLARLQQRRRLVITALLAPVVILPPLAYLIASAFDSHPDLTTGVLLVAASPIGGISNTYSYLARASTALSVTLTTLSCAAAPLTVPLISAGLGAALGAELGLSAPLPYLLRYISLIIGLPLAIGMLLRRRVPALAARYRPRIETVAFAGVTAILALVILDDVDAFVDVFNVAAPLAIIFVTVSFAVGWCVAAAITSDRHDRFTVATEFGARNVGVATAIAVTVLGRVEYARFGAAYFLTEVPLLLVFVVIYRRLSR